MSDDWVLVDPEGMILEGQVPGDVGPATLLVEPVVDALKRLGPEGLLDRHLDRESVWAVSAFALNRVVIERLGDGEHTARELHDAVVAAGFKWQLKPLVRE